MKSNIKFFSGLSLGLLIGFMVFNAPKIISKNNEALPKTTETQSSNDPSKEGEFITTEAANALISAYKTGFVDKNGLPSNTTIGGVISKSNLNKVCGLGADDLIKFRFYLTQSTEGADQIGVIFYKKSDATEALRTGSASFCPVMCN
ncbi:MAG: hypothetical protein H6607_10315 [Flavobacteriales bacterium]|nr:hypothetical protein [Flavobacteriales bacterium]